MLEKPDPPIVGKVTHSTIELNWAHVKERLESNQRYKYSLQELSNTNKREWGTIYSGYSVSTTIDGLEPLTEYTYRLCVIDSNNQKSEYSSGCTVRTTKEPFNGELFHKAIILDRKSEIEKMLESPSGSKFLEIPDKFGNLPLMVAIIRNNFEIFESLIEHDADVNAQNENLKTPLMIAAFYGKLEYIKVLRRYGAVYDIRDKAGLSAIHYAVDGGNVQAVEWLLLDGADVNSRDNNGWTPLIRSASVCGSADVAKILIKFKAKIDVVDKENKNALLIATINGNLPLVKVLVENGANYRLKNNFGKSLYDLAVSMDRKTIVKYFEESMENA